MAHYWLAFWLHKKLLCKFCKCGGVNCSKDAKQRCSTTQWRLKFHIKCQWVWIDKALLMESQISSRTKKKLKLLWFNDLEWLSLHQLIQPKFQKSWDSFQIWMKQKLKYFKSRVNFMYFLFNDTPNVLYRWKIWTAARPTQYLPAFIVPSKTCKLPTPYALMHPHTIRDAGFWTKRWWHAGRSPSSLARRTQHPWLPTRMSNFDSSNHKTLSHFEKVKIWLPFCMIELWL